MKKILFGITLLFSISYSATMKSDGYDLVPYAGANVIEHTNTGYKIGFRLYQENSSEKSGFMMDASYSKNRGRNSVKTYKFFMAMAAIVGDSDVNISTLQALLGYHLKVKSFPIYLDTKVGYSINKLSVHRWDIVTATPPIRLKNKNINIHNNGMAYGLALGYVNGKNIDFNLGYTATKSKYDSAYLTMGYKL